MEPIEDDTGMNPEGPLTPAKKRKSDPSITQETEDWKELIIGEVEETMAKIAIPQLAEELDRRFSTIQKQQNETAMTANDVLSKISNAFNNLQKHNWHMKRNLQKPVVNRAILIRLYWNCDMLNKKPQKK